MSKMAVKKYKEEDRVSQDIQTEPRVSQDIRNTTSSYRALDNSGNDYAGMAGMSDLHKAALDAAGKSWTSASQAGDQAGMAAAHQQAEAIRALYGYSGGADGSQYIPVGLPKENFSYDQAPSYNSQYQSQIDALTQAILNRDPFQYNYLEDPNYQQYQESYTREGQRAMQDTLGQVSARTGGLASSYATAASQQTYDNYMAALADKIPELRQLAYSMYVDEGNQMRSNLDMLLALEQGDYAKYQDLLGQYNTDRSFHYGVYRDDLGDQRYNQEWNYQVGRDTISDQRYQDETAWNREQYQSETDYARALEKAQTLAAAGDFSGYKALGYTDEEIANLESAYQQQHTPRSYASGGGSDSNPQESASYDMILEQARAYDDINDAKAYLERMVDDNYLTAEEAAYLYQVGLGGTPAYANVPTTYEEYVRLTGQPLINTPDNFQSAKQRGGNWADKYADYQEYLAEMYAKYLRHSS